MYSTQEERKDQHMQILFSSTHEFEGTAPSSTRGRTPGPVTAALRNMQRGNVIRVTDQDARSTSVYGQVSSVSRQTGRLFTTKVDGDSILVRRKR